MATKREREDGSGGPVAELERATDAPPDIASQPKMVIAAGRGKVGKSVMLRWAIERCVQRGGEPVIADCDRTNQTLAAFLPAAMKPPSAEDDDVREWLNDLADTQIERRSTSFLDLGGGDLTLKQWARDLDLAPFLAKNGITPVVLHLLGSDLDDLSYLRDLETVFAPQHTAVILNEGMVPSGRSPIAAFGPIIDHPVFKAAVSRGAVVLKIPRLGCMQDVDRRRLSFQDAEDGNVKPGQERMGPTMRQMISLWRRDMESNTAQISSWIT
jgi:hypothetical protein